MSRMPLPVRHGRRGFAAVSGEAGTGRRLDPEAIGIEPAVVDDEDVPEKRLPRLCQLEIAADHDVARF